MNKTRFLTILSSALLLANLALVAFVVLKKPLHDPDGPKRLIIEKLQLDQDQIAAYDVLIKNHREKIKAQDLIISNLKDKLYTGLNAPVDSVLKDSLIIGLGKAQENIEQIHYQHFRDIQKLCNPGQQTAFEALTKELSSIFNKGPKKPKDK